MGGETHELVNLQPADALLCEVFHRAGCLPEGQ